MSELDDHPLVKEIEAAIGKHIPSLPYGDIKMISGFVLVFCACPSAEIRGFLVEEMRKMAKGAQEKSKEVRKEIKEQMDKLSGKKDIVN